jgi:hypothetical protein
MSWDSRSFRTNQPVSGIETHAPNWIRICSGAACAERKEAVSMRHRTVGVIAGLLLCAPYASAQSTSPQPLDGEWQLEVVPYLWGSGMDGAVGIGDRTADVDASFGNILDHLHFAVMGLADARRDRLVVLADTIYTDLRGHRATPGPLFSSVEPQQRMFILTPEAGYRLLGNEDASFDVVGGIRYWHLKSELEFRAGVLPDIGLEASRGWVDGIFGLRARTVLMRQWWVSAYGDIGAGQSDVTYQLTANAGLDLSDRFALSFGYRYLNVDYDQDDFLFDTALKGPLFGFGIRF